MSNNAARGLSNRMPKGNALGTRIQKKVYQYPQGWNKKTIPKKKTVDYIGTAKNIIQKGVQDAADTHAAVPEQKSPVPVVASALSQSSAAGRGIFSRTGRPMDVLVGNDMRRPQPQGLNDPGFFIRSDFMHARPGGERNLPYGGGINSFSLSLLGKGRRVK